MEQEWGWVTKGKSQVGGPWLCWHWCFWRSSWNHLASIYKVGQDHPAIVLSKPSMAWLLCRCQHGVLAGIASGEEVVAEASIRCAQVAWCPSWHTDAVVQTCVRAVGCSKEMVHGSLQTTSCSWLGWTCARSLFLAAVWDWCRWKEDPMRDAMSSCWRHVRSRKPKVRCLLAGRAEATKGVQFQDLANRRKELWVLWRQPFMLWGRHVGSGLQTISPENQAGDVGKRA